MITHNGKQVTLAMRNRQAINLIARNGKAMFGELEDLNCAGIDLAAKAVILAEYGKQVWRDVRDYAKAHPAIVPFINQDPHLACSISPNSNKERWLVSDSDNPYIDFGQTWQEAGYTLDIEFRHLHNQSTNQVYIFGSQVWSGGALLIHDRMNPPYSLYPNDGSYEDLGDGTYIVRLASSNKNTVGSSNKVTLLGGNIAQKGLVRINYFRGTIGTREYDLVPCVTTDQGAGMLDLVTYTFHPNANTQGQFTIAITDKE